MSERKKLLPSIPMEKELIYEFKFDLSPNNPPLSYPKTLYYPLDPERH